MTRVSYCTPYRETPDLVRYMTEEVQPVQMQGDKDEAVKGGSAVTLILQETKYKNP